MLCVEFQVIGDLILRWECFSSTSKSHAGEFDVAGGREQAQRVPAISPGISDSVVRIQNQKVNSSLGQVITHGQSRLASPYDNCVNALCAKLALHSHLHVDEPKLSRDSAHRTNCAVVEKIGWVFLCTNHTSSC